MLAAISVSCVLIYFAIKFWVNNRRKWKLINQVPGPKPLFLIGNVLDISKSEKLFKKFGDWTKEYGSIFKINVVHELQYIISDNGLLEYICSSNELITKNYIYKFFVPWLNNGLLVSTGEKWRKRRKAITPTFHFKILEQFIEIFDRSGNILIKQLEKEVDKPSIDIYPYMTLCTLDVICETAMGVSQNAQITSDSEYVNAVRWLLNDVMERSFSITNQFDCLYRFSKNYKQQQKCLKLVHDFTDSIISQRRNELLENSSKGNPDQNDLGVKKKIAFLDMLLQATIDGKPLSNLDIREEVDTFMFEGHDTTASAMSFTLYCLSQHPEAQQKAFEEIESILQGDKDRAATYVELQEMKYLEMVCKEVQRIYPTVPFVGRIATEDFKYGEYTFVKGSSLILYFHGAHMNPKNFENPEEFNPDRWLDDSSDRHVFSYLPFSAGPRNCIGQKFAMLELKSLLSKILMKYELKPSVPKVEMIVGNEAVLKSKNGIHLSLTKRK